MSGGWLLTSVVRGPGDGVGLTGWDELAQARMADGIAAGWLSGVGWSIGRGQRRESGEAGCECELHFCCCLGTEGLIWVWEYKQVLNVKERLVVKERQQ